MAITYTNVMKSNVMDSLNVILQGEFTGQLPVHYDLDYQSRSPQYINVTPIEDELIELESNGQTRGYLVELRYYLRKGGQYARHTHIDHLANMVERIKRLLHNNSNYSSGGSYKFHDGRIVSIDWRPDMTDEEEADPDLNVIVITWQCHVTEVL